METNFENQLQEEQITNVDPEQSSIPAEEVEENETDVEETEDLEEEGLVVTDEELDLDEGTEEEEGEDEL